MTGREDFLSRWARRKAEAKTAALPQADDLPAPAPAAPVPDGAPEPPAEPPQPDMLRDDPPDDETRAAWIEKLEAVDLDALDYKDDFTVFLRSWVPQALRNRALKRLWSTSDVFAVLDGLAEYDEDYTDAATVIGDVRTSWKPGRGYADDEVAVEDEADAGENPDEAADEPEPGGDDAPADDEEALAESENDAAPAKKDEDDDVG